jgi:carbamoyl-phosphate synthase large subunit
MINKKKFNVLVTGCGGDIGQSMGKILIESTFVDKLYSCDISDKHAAKFIYPNFFIGLPAKDVNYVINLENVVLKYDIDFIIPLSEPELRFFAKESIYNIGKAKIITASEKALKIGFDKLLTANFLKEQSLPFPITFSLDDIETVNSFPAILKSRTGAGSANIHIVYDQETFSYLKRKEKDFIVQEYLEGDNGEYTCGVFRSAKGITRSIILKRELMGSFTGYAEVIANEDITKLLNSIADNLNLRGSINVQLRITHKGPVVFEINPRFSSTVRFRDLLGFKDVQWTFEDLVGLPISDYNDTSVGKKVYKGFMEYIQ